MVKKIMIETENCCVNYYYCNKNGNQSLLGGLKHENKASHGLL